MAASNPGKIARTSSVLYFSDPVKVSDFRANWLKELSSNAERSDNPDESVANANDVVDTDDRPSRNGDEAMFPASLLTTMPDISAELRKELVASCSVTVLNCDGETSLYEYASRQLANRGTTLPNVPKNVDLTTLKLQAQDLNKRWNDKTYSCLLNDRRKFINLERHQTSDTAYDDNYQEFAVSPTEVVLTVMVCDPSKEYVKKCFDTGGVKFFVLGSQKLTELRDKIGCTTDIMVPGDFSFNPSLEIDTRAKDLYKSGFFHINGVFYNDTRDPSCRDYSKVIIDWAQSDPSRNMGPYTSKKMEETTFLDLELKLGYPYIYTHQGNCEHFLAFIDLRLVSPKDCLDKRLYPICCWSKGKRRRMCMTCHMCTARWIVQQNPRLPTDPFCFCDSCFHSFNYTSDGTKIGDFVARPYLDRVAII